jgi:hypothetical protein
MRETNKARNWVEANYPEAHSSTKALLILAYGAGLDAGLVEAQDILLEAATEMLTPEQMEQVKTTLRETL